jgi:RND superfamily putative drug exporter
VLFGLAMDYEVFLVSGMREEYVKTREPRKAIVHGFQHAARVVTAAALIMFFVFFAFVPEGSGVIKGIAFALAVGVVFDAFLVRMTLVPAAMALAGRAAWWLPKWLEKRLPDVDIEGEGLRAHLEQQQWAAERPAAVNVEEAVFGVPERPIGPLTTEVPTGGVLVVRGEAVDRRVVAASLAGRLAPVSGRLAVLGEPLPSGSRSVMRGVAIAEVATDAATGGTVGEMIARRVDATRPWYRVGPSTSLVRTWVERAADAAGHGPDGPRFTADTPLAALGVEARTLVAVAAALAERPDAAVIDLDDPGSSSIELWQALARLVPISVTIIVGLGTTAVAPDASAELAARGIRTIEPSSATSVTSVTSVKEATR